MTPTPNAHQETSDSPNDSVGALLPVHHFRHQGKEYTLRKRKPDRFAPWYFVSAVRGKRFNHALGTNDVKLAEMTARNKYIAPALVEDWQRVDAGKLKRHFATVDAVVTTWRGLALGAGEAHKRAASNALLNVLRQAGLAQPGAESSAILTGTTAGKFFDAVVRRAAAEPDQQAAARVKRTALSLFNQARCVLQPAALREYQRAGVHLPDVVEFLAEGELRRKKFKGVRVVHEPPDWKLVDAVLAAWPGLADWNAFAAVGLELALGLRAGEVAQVRWEWFAVEDGVWHLSTRAAAVKNQTGALRVPALDPFWSTFRARALAEGRWGAGGTVLTGTESERRDLVFRRVSEWLRGLGWEKQKTNHGLRSYAGAEVAIRWRSPFTTQMWLRHESVTTTEKHYTKQWMDAQQARTSRVEWARA